MLSEDFLRLPIQMSVLNLKLAKITFLHILRSKHLYHLPTPLYCIISEVEKNIEEPKN